MDNEPQTRLIVPFFVGGQFMCDLEPSFRNNGYKIKYIPNDILLSLWSTRKINSNKVIYDHLNHSPTKDLEYYLNKYDINSPKEFIFPDIVLKEEYPEFPVDYSGDINYMPGVDRLHKYLSFFDALFESDKGGIPIQYQGGTVLRRSLRVVSNYHGYPNVWIGFSPIPNHSALYENEFVNWDPFCECHSSPSSLSQKVASQFLEEYLSNNIDFSTSVNWPSLSVLQSLKRKYNRLWYQDTSRLLKEYIQRKRSRIIKTSKELRNKRHYLSKTKSLKFIKHNNFVFFPLQYFRESRTTIRGNQYYDYRWLVELISRKLPYNYNLVIKNHPNHLGDVRPSVIDNISTFGTMIHPEIETKKIIRESSAVITINNTVGFESIMLGKPIVCLGNAFYRNCDSVITISNIWDLEDYIKEGVNTEDYNRESVINSISQVVEASYAGSWGNTQNKNPTILANSILDFLSSIEHKYTYNS